MNIFTNIIYYKSIYIYMHTHCDMSCAASMSHMCPAKADENQELISAIWGLSGDIHIMLVQRTAELEVHREDFLQQREEDRAIWESARLELGSVGG